MKSKTTTDDPFYMSLQSFTEFTCELIRLEEYSSLHTCLNLIERLLTKGEREVKAAILQYYIPNLYSFIQKHNSKTIVDLFPFYLREAYNTYLKKKQVKNDLLVFTLYLN